MNEYSIAEIANNLGWIEPFFNAYLSKNFRGYFMVALRGHKPSLMRHQAQSKKNSGDP